jgi:hypothetical protein
MKELINGLLLTGGKNFHLENGGIFGRMILKWVLSERVVYREWSVVHLT